MTPDERAKAMDCATSTRIHLTESSPAAFRARPHRVDPAAGFVRMEVLCPLDRPQEIWLLTHWRCGDDYRAWHRGHGYRESYRGIPKGLKLAGRETCIREFQVVCE